MLNHEVISTSIGAVASGARASDSCCRFCSAPLEHTFLDLGMSPLAQLVFEKRRCQSRLKNSFRCERSSLANAFSCNWRNGKRRRISKK